MKTPTHLWANELVSQFIEGAADSFLIVSGGAAVAQTGALALPTITPKQLLCSVLLGGLWYVAAFLKKTPTPSAMPLPATADEKRPLAS